MKLLICLPVFFLLFCSTSVFGQDAFEQFPKLETVYAYLDRQITTSSEDYRFELAKKADGCYLGIVKKADVNSNEVTYLKCWDAYSKKFLPLNLKAYFNSDKDKKDAEKGIEHFRSQETEFDFNYLFGYENYTTDLITYLEKKKELTTHELEMLARAYSNEASDYIHPGISGAKITVTKKLSTPSYEKISADRIESFKTLADKSITYYEQIQKIDPDYKPIIIKDISVKINEEFMHYFQSLQLVKEPELAKTYLNRVNFSSTEIATAESILDACPKNSILFTGGDNDSYPFWYIQEKMNFRKDVTVINQSLLAAPYYFDYIKQTSPVKTTLNTKEYSSLIYYYTVTSKQTEETVSFSTWIKQLKESLAEVESTKNEKSLTEALYPETYPAFLLERNNIQVSLGSSNGYYLMASDIAILDILASNKNTPVYLSNPSVFSGLNTENTYATRGVYFEYVGNKEIEYWDSQSMKALEKELTAANVYSANSTCIDEMMFYGLGFSIQYAVYKNEKNAKQLYSVFTKKLEADQVVEFGDEQLVDFYARIAGYISAEDLDNLLELYAVKAEKQLAEISTTKTLSGSDVQTLVFIYEVYSQNDLERDVNPDSDFSAIQKKVLKLLKTKVSKMTQLKSNKEELSWSYKTLLELNESLGKLKL